MPAAARASERTTHRSLDRLGSIVVAKRNQTVIEEGQAADYVFKVITGALRVVRLLPDGRRHVASFLLPGDFFGLSPSGVHTQTIEVVADATCVRYPRRGFDAILRTDPAAIHRLLTLISGQLSAAHDRLLLLGRQTAAERLAAFLLALDHRDRSGAPKRPTIELAMCRADIADYLGMTVETVSRLLTEFRRKGIIELPEANHVVLLRRSALEGLSSGRLPIRRTRP